MITKNHGTGAEALRMFPEPEHVAGSHVVVDYAGHIGLGFASGLVTREDGAIAPDGGRPIELPGS